ncbi:hypothetical protein [Vibrio phage R01]|nr:hypothetical protein [Vibrio phage R01]
MLNTKNKYVVLTISGEIKQFEKHAPAFKHCENHADKIKGVFKILGSATVGAVNVWTDSQFWEGEQKLKQQHSQLTFKVI